MAAHKQNPSKPIGLPPLKFGANGFLVSFTIISILLVTVYYLWQSYTQAVDRADSTTRNLVSVVESRLSGDFARANAILTVVADEMAQDRDLADDIRQRPAQAHRLARMVSSFPTLSGLFVFDAQGQLRFSSQSDFRPMSVADRPHFQAMQADPNLTTLFSQALVSRTTGTTSIVQSRAIRDSHNTLLGTVNAVIHLDVFARLFSDIDVGPGGTIVFRRSDDFSLILRIPNRDDNEINQSLPADNAIRQTLERGQRSGTLSYVASTDGVRRRASFKLMDGFPFYIQVAQAETHILRGWRQQVAGTAAAVAGLFAVLGFVLYRLRRTQRREVAVLQRLRISEEKHRLVQDATAVGIWDWDMVGDRVVWDLALWRLLGRPPQDRPMTRAEAWAMMHPADLPQVQRTIEDSIRVGDRFAIECRYPAAKGDWRWLQFKGQVVERDADNAPLRMTGTADDIHLAVLERRRADEVLDRLQKIAAHVPGMVYQYQIWPDGRSAFPYASQGILHIYGVTPDQVVRDGSAVFKQLHPDDVGHVADSITISARDLTPWCDQYRVRRPDGPTIWVEGEATPERQPDGSTLWHGYIRDITENKLREQASADLMRQLQHSNAELEQFAYVASHDLRQPLRMVSSYVKLLERRLHTDLDDETRQYMGFISDGATRMDQMLMSLLEYSRVGRRGEPMRPISSRLAVDEALLFLSPAITEAKAEITITGDWPEVTASRDSFTRLFQNLIGNAVKYRTSDRTVQITVSVDDLGDCWRFSIADNGIGIDPSQFDRLFRVFQRLQSREHYEGTGIGLAVTRKIVEHHGGKIWVESTGEGQGCTFRFTLPKQASPHPAG